MENLAEAILDFCSESPEARAYAETHLGRFVKTVELTPPGAPGERLLEMGAYFQITPIFPRLGYSEVRGCYLGPAGAAKRKEVVSASGQRFACTVDFFDAEADPFPYPDGWFATVVCCELVEHLGEDPMAMMAEINRVLRPGGRLVLSTPNLCAWRAVAAVLTGYHPNLYGYFTARRGGNKVEPRHAREYAPREVAKLLEDAGFEVERLESTDCGLEPRTEFDWVRPIVEQHGDPTVLRGEVVHALGRKTGPVAERFPAWLYD